MLFSKRLKLEFGRKLHKLLTPRRTVNKSVIQCVDNGGKRFQLSIS